MMAQPPTTSFASAYGPSTRLTSPWRTTKFTASSVPYRPPPSRNTPLAARSPMYSSIASNSAWGGVPTPSSILTKPMKRGMSFTTTGRWWGCFSPVCRTAATFFDIGFEVSSRTFAGGLQPGERRLVAVAAVVLLEDLPEHRLVRRRPLEQRHRGTELQRVDGANHLDRVVGVDRGELLGGGDQPRSEH